MASSRTTNGTIDVLALQRVSGSKARALLAETLIGALTFTLYSDTLAQDYARGTNWPVHAISMGGTSALWNVAFAVETVLAEHIEGDFVETGVWKGASGILARKLLDAARDETRWVFCLDSYKWLPPPSDEFAVDKGDTHSTLVKQHPLLKADIGTVRRIYHRFGIDTNAAASRTELVPGWFNETAEPLAERIRSISILRLDGDMYESTWQVLTSLYWRVSVGGFVIIDDYALRGARIAAHDFRACVGTRAPLVRFPIKGPETRYMGVGGKAYWRKDANSESGRACGSYLSKNLDKDPVSGEVRLHPGVA